MQAFPKFETRVPRVIAWLTALVALALLAAPRAKAEDATQSRPPVSDAAVKAAAPTTTTTPAPTAAPTTTPTPAPTAPAPAKASTKSSKKSSKKAVKPPVEEAAPTPMAAKEVSLDASASDSSMTLRGGKERTDFAP
jgi:hypothetical protein